MLNKKENQQYTKEDIEFFDMLSSFKKNYNSSEINIIQNESNVEAKYTISDNNNFKHIIKNQDNDVVDYISHFNSLKQKDSYYSKSDLKNFEKFDTQVHSYDIDHDNFKDKIKSTKMSQTNYKKNDLENFDQIIKNEEGYEKNLVKIVNVGGRKNPKLKNDNPNLKKIKILYFD